MEHMMKRQFGFGVAAVIASAFLLFLFGVIRNQTLDYWYLPYNLSLAAIPLGLAVWIRSIVKKLGWKDWRAWILMAGWLFFLPNSFYIVTDFIHLPETMRIDIVQDSVMLMQFSLLGYGFGFASLYVLHQTFSSFLKPRIAWVGAVMVLFLASFAIYLGRELRWNSWDIITNPFLVIRDSMTILFHPAAHPNGLWMTVTFFVALATLYAAIYQGIALLRKRRT